MQAHPTLQIKVLIRFSYLAENGFQKVGPNNGDPRTVLYDPARLAWRLQVFERLCLHSLIRQSHRDFQVGVLIGQDMPRAVRQRLRALVQPYSHMHLIALEPMAHYTAMRRAFARIPDKPGATHTATVRLDDDDALHGQTLARLHHLAMGLLPLLPTDAPLAIGFNRGVFVTLGQVGQAQEVIERTPLGIGLALVAPVGDPVNVFRRNHRLLGQFFDLYTDTQLPAWVRSVHPGNDSGAVKSGQTLDTSQARLADILRDGFDLSLHDLEHMTGAAHDQ